MKENQSEYVEFLYVIFDKPLAVNATYVVNISFAGSFSEDVHGMDYTTTLTRSTTSKSQKHYSLIKQPRIVVKTYLTHVFVLFLTIDRFGSAAYILCALEIFL